uniref:Uncharacterized protein n=1 Tax=Helianthus annuus TaxID=4232 RepID=A0A251URW9_HELAN
MIMQKTFFPPKFLNTPRNPNLPAAALSSHSLKFPSRVFTPSTQTLHHTAVPGGRTPSCFSLFKSHIVDTYMHVHLIITTSEF